MKCLRVAAVLLCILVADVAAQSSPTGVGFQKEGTLGLIRIRGQVS